MAQTEEENVFPLIGICHAKMREERCRAADGCQRQLENQDTKS
jgi:hypothetical protein